MIRRISSGLILRCAFMVLYVGMVLWCTGSVMRESDQASVIDGSLQLARDGEIQGRDFYNYDRTYGSYWILSSVYKSAGLEVVNSPSDEVVAWGNRVAAGVFLLGLVPAFICFGPSKWWEWVVAVACLFSPVLLFSVPLLSSNVISAGFLFGLVAVLSKRGSVAVDMIAGVLAFCAVAARADAVLVMPVLACLSTKESTLGSLVKDRRIWVMVLACVTALVLGSVIYPATMYKPATFFNGKLLISFFVFAMNGGFVVLLVLLIGLFQIAWKDRSLFHLLILGVVVLPILFYGRVLYSPRHLMTTVLVLMFSVILLRGRELWTRLLVMRWVRLSLLIVGGVTVLSSFVGLGMNSFRSGKVVLTQPTLYPTADGFWPMGANFWFSGRLQNARNVPIDHNQRIWQAWESMDETDLPSGPVSVKSHGLVSYGELRLSMLGHSSGPEEVESGSVLVDGRSLLKTPMGMAGEAKEAVGASLKNDQDVRELSSSANAGIFCVGDQYQETSARWKVLKALNEYAHGDDYVLMKSDSKWHELQDRGPFRWLLVIPQSTEPEFDRWVKRNREIKVEKIKNSEVGAIYGFVSKDGMWAPDFEMLPEDVWVARSALVLFMQRKNYH